MPQLTKVILRKKSSTGVHTILGLKLYYRIIVTQYISMMLAQKQTQRQTEWNRRPRKNSTYLLPFDF
jgi:hypothetical protein